MVMVSSPKPLMDLLASYNTELSQGAHRIDRVEPSRNLCRLSQKCGHALMIVKSATIGRTATLCPDLNPSLLLSNETNISTARCCTTYVITAVCESRPDLVHLMT